MDILSYKEVILNFTKFTSTAQCADSEVRNAFERTPYVVVLKFNVFILISKSFNFWSSLERILRYLTKTWFQTPNFEFHPSPTMLFDSVSDTIMPHFCIEEWGITVTNTES